MRFSPTSRPGLRLAPALLLCALGTLALTANVARAEKFPEPNVYPLGNELKFTHGTPKRIAVQVPGDPNPRGFWYMTYTLTNEGKEAFRFLPQFDMLTDDGRSIRSDRAISPA